jgi:hypothetical protein
MFPRDSQTYIGEITANNTTLLASGTMRTFLYANVDCVTASDIHLQVGNTGSIYILDTETSVAPHENILLNYATTSLIRFQTSLALASPCYVNIVYVNRDRSIVPDPETSSSTVATSSISIGTSTVMYVPQMTTESYIYMILAVVGLLLYIFKK